jgi:hypothetical protein
MKVPTHLPKPEEMAAKKPVKQAEAKRKLTRYTAEALKRRTLNLWG